MTASKQVDVFDIWLAYLYFADKPTVGKVRPVLIVGCEKDHIAVAKITSHPPREDFAGEFAITRWRDVGLNVASTVRCSQVFELDARELLRDHPIGHLCDEDISGVTRSLVDAGFYNTNAQ